MSETKKQRCIRCRKEYDGIQGARYCPYCGAIQQRKRGVRQRGNGTGTAVKEGGSWRARLVIGWKMGDDNIERPITRTKRGFKTKREALEYIPQLRGVRPTKVNLDHYWKMWSENEMAQLSKSKQTAYKIAYKKLGRIVYKDIPDITVEDLRRIVQENCPSYYTARDVRTVLKRLYEMADADGIGNPRLPSYIKLPTLEEKEGEAFTEDEIAAIWSAYDSGVSDCGYILMMIYTGMMPGELCLLKKDSIDLQSKTIVSAGIKTKVRKKTPIAIADIIAPVVDALGERSTTSRFLPCNRDQFYQRYHAATAAAGVRDLPPYSCRHTTATALAVGVNVAPEIIRKVMRWSTTKMLDRYAHPDITDAIEAVNQITKKPV